MTYWPILKYLAQLPDTYRLESQWADPWNVRGGDPQTPNWRISARMPNGQRVVYRNRKDATYLNRNAKIR